MKTRTVHEYTYNIFLFDSRSLSSILFIVNRSCTCLKKKKKENDSKCLHSYQTIHSFIVNSTNSKIIIFVRVHNTYITRYWSLSRQISFDLYLPWKKKIWRKKKTGTIISINNNITVLLLLRISFLFLSIVFLLSICCNIICTASVCLSFFHTKLIDTH